MSHTHVGLRTRFRKLGTVDCDMVETTPMVHSGEEFLALAEFDGPLEKSLTGMLV